MTQKEIQALCRKLNASPWQQSVLQEELSNPWHTGTPTDEGDYLLVLRFENLKLDVAHFKDGVFMSYHDHIIASSYIKLWQKIEHYEGTEEQKK